MKKSIVFLILFSVSIASAKDFFNKKDFVVALGVQANTILHKRGIITYEGYQVFPIYSLNLFNPNLQLIGSGLYYKQWLVENKLLFRTRLLFDATNDRPLYYTSEKEDDRVRRDQTNELDLFLEYESESNHYLRLQFSQDLVKHNGQYLELHTRYPLYDIINKADKALLRANLFGSIGYGDSNHNKYLYGNGADRNGINNIEYGLMLTSPKVIENFWPTLRITRFELIGDNKDGSYVKETSGWNIQALAAFRVW